VNIFMGRFKKLGFLVDDGGVLRIDPALLHVVYDGERSASARTGGVNKEGAL
jgi:hypothetical protein